ncbi:Rap1a/Tai family immunity protein [Pseudomonas sp. SDT2931_S440]
MKAGIAAGIALVAVMGSGGLLAADGNHLLITCKEAIRDSDGERTTNSLAAGYCYGLVNGVMSTMTTMNEYMLPKERTCFPSGLMNQQAVRIVAKYLEEHPASLHRDGAFLAMAAFQNAYLCK